MVAHCVGIPLDDGIMVEPGEGGTKREAPGAGEKFYGSHVVTTHAR